MENLNERDDIPIRTDNIPITELVDHYQRVGDGPCPYRIPSGHFYSPAPKDAHVQCKTCQYARLCFEADRGEPAGLVSEDIEVLDDQESRDLIDQEHDND